MSEVQKNFTLGIRVVCALVFNECMGLNQM